MKSAIFQRARELGFDDCRFTTARPPDHAAQFQNWLRSGCHGQMDYLARNAYKRIDPVQVLAAAKTIVTLAASYAAPPGDEMARPGAMGEIARYARFTEVISERCPCRYNFRHRENQPTEHLTVTVTFPMDNR